MWSSLFGSSPLQNYKSQINFTINGKSYQVGRDSCPTTSLNSYIREVAHLTGTKFMCNEGGCGACVVTATWDHPVSKHRETFAINSCLVPVMACDGWAITTVEGIGDRQTGYHKAQGILAQFNGTQCGYCSPGMVMNMYGLLESGKAPSMADVENAFGGNLCRCTGYRPILDAFKSLATDASPNLKQACLDIEDTYKRCSKTGAPCSGKCSTSCDQSSMLPIRILAVENDVLWYKPINLNQIFEIFSEIGDVPYKLVFGNTSEGVYKSLDIKAYIDIKDVPDLRSSSTTPLFTVGANTTLTEAIEIFKEAAKHNNALKYMHQLAVHIDKIANVPVRNIGTLAGNLSIKRAHPQFPSDIFTIFETVGATLNIVESGGRISNIALLEYLQYDMRKKVVMSISFPNLTQNHKFRTFKIAPRAQNSHAYVNAGFLLEFNDFTQWQIVGKPRIVYGGINPEFAHVDTLEEYLIGKSIFDTSTIAGAMAELNRKLNPDHDPVDSSPSFRKTLAQALFYKFIIGLESRKFNPLYQSGGTDLERPLSSGKQEFDEDPSKQPVHKAIPKIDALVQCSGEAEYVNDLPESPGELHGAFVITQKASGTITKIDPSAALQMAGVVGFFSHEDLLTPNSFTPRGFGNSEDEEIFCSGQVRYAGQAVGLIVAETRMKALSAVPHVIVEYANVTSPVLTIEEILRTAGDRIDKDVTTSDVDNDAVNKGDPSPHTITGTFEIGKQYHMTMETSTCLIVPKEGSYDVYCASQWMDLIQYMVSQVLQVPASQVNVVVRRLGGGYGMKITRPPQLAAACAIAVKKLNRPVRLVMTLGDNMEMHGKRFGYKTKYEVGVDNNGKIERLTTTLFQDCGITYNDSPMGSAREFIKNCYQINNLQVIGRKIKTDTAANTWCRGPGTTEGIAFIEEIMERIAHTLGLDPLAVRMTNMATNDSPMPEMINYIKEKADYENRKTAVAEFNDHNRWKKKGIAIVPMRYPFSIWGNYEVLVAIYQIDGSVSISHGGIEMGQGLNTKAAQVAAYAFGIPLDKITIQPSNTTSGANSIVTGGSLGSEAVAYGTLMACQELMKRLEPIKSTMPSGATWQQIIKAAHMQNVELVATHMFSSKDNVKPYIIWGVSIAEVEVDILTGEKQVLRVDILEDAGNSLSPMVDIGQIEGSFIMGMGYWLQEELKYHRGTGRLLTNRTWNYKPPGAKDIPVDFRIYFRKNSPNELGVLQSKATGEPPLNMAVVVFLAVRNAVASARKDAGAAPGYYIIKQPATPEHTFMDSLTSPEQFVL